MSDNKIVEATSKKVMCNGGSNSLGHPGVYLNMGDKKEIVCPYCSKKFILVKNKV